MIDNSVYADVGEFKKDYEEKLNSGDYIIDYTTATSKTSENPKQPPINIPMNKNDKSIQVKPNSEKSTISQTAKLKAIQKAYETKRLQTIEGIYHTPKAKAKVAMPIQQQPI